VRSDGVVVVPPLSDQDLCFLQDEKILAIEQLVSRNFDPRSRLARHHCVHCEIASSKLPLMSISAALAADSPAMSGAELCCSGEATAQAAEN